MWPFDQNNQQMYQQYAQAYDTGNNYGIDHNQVWGHLQQFMQGAPYDMQQRVYQQHFEQMPFEQRVAMAQQMPQGYYMDPNDTGSMAQAFHRLGQEQPHMIQRIFSHPLLTGAALGLVGLVAKHALSQHHNTPYQQQYGNQPQPQYAYNQGFQPDAQQQLYQEQQEVQELRRELRQEERREERLEERERHHHRREEW